MNGQKQPGAVVLEDAARTSIAGDRAALDQLVRGLQGDIYGLSLRMLEDLQEGRAVSHDFTNRFLIERGFDVDSCTPEAAGGRLARLGASHDFTLYEHFITDRIGHSQGRDLARDHMRELTRFLRATLEAADLSRQTVVVTSDHGNIEDLSTRSHTLNPVATLAFGPGRHYVASRVRCLTDIAPAIVDTLSG